LRLAAYEKQYRPRSRLIAKPESFHPAGSVKDRVALAGRMEDAERKGVWLPGATLIEPASGNTGVGLAVVAAIKGYKQILTMPETLPLERRHLLESPGACLVLTDGKRERAAQINRS